MIFIELDPDTVPVFAGLDLDRFRQWIPDRVSVPRCPGTVLSLRLPLLVLLFLLSIAGFKLQWMDLVSFSNSSKSCVSRSAGSR